MPKAPPVGRRMISKNDSIPPEHLLVTARLQYLPHLHRIARGNFLEGYSQLIGGDAGEALEHRPQLLQRLGLFGISVATAIHSSTLRWEPVRLPYIQTPSDRRGRSLERNCWALSSMSCVSA